MSYVLQNDDGQIAEAHSISAGLDYPGRRSRARVLQGRWAASSTCRSPTTEALEGFQALTRLEGIMPALESAHAVAHAMRARRAHEEDRERSWSGLSGRGDKDVHIVGQGAATARRPRKPARDGRPRDDDLRGAARPRRARARSPTSRRAIPRSRDTRGSWWRRRGAAPTSSSSACRSRIPLADGPVIQRADPARARRRASRCRACSRWCARCAREVAVPLVFLTYYNPILAFGLKAFCRTAVEAGIDGVIVADLPPEEAESAAAPRRSRPGSTSCTWWRRPRRPSACARSRG